MGSINLNTQSLFGSLSDMIGCRSGLALTRAEIEKLFREDGRYAGFQDAADNAWVRIESVVYEEMLELLLYSVGRLEKLGNVGPMATLLHKYGRDKESVEMACAIGELFTTHIEAAIASPSREFDVDTFMKTAAEKYGRTGLDMAVDVLHAHAAQMTIKSLGEPGIQPYDDIVQLKDLFESEELSEQFGTFLDQRYIDYLNRNFDDIDAINWRKFEGLTAEYFTREGHKVELGPGRNDDGVDVRVSPTDARTNAPPAILIQCKRQKNKVSKVVVKALYADVTHHKAKSGLIVTTSTLSKGAKTVCEARNYPIDLADRETLRNWISAMRKPGAGVIG